MRVAILDDETAELQRLEQTLQSMDESQRAPWLTHCFCRGEEMLRRLKRERYDLLILDWQAGRATSDAEAEKERARADADKARREAEHPSDHARSEESVVIASDSPPSPANSGRRRGAVNL